MYEIDAFKINKISANITQLPVKRDWMEKTYDRHAYNCFPVTLTNRLGYGISFPEEISFVWNGVSNSSPNNVKILSGHEYVYTGRANGTISFKTGIRFKTEENISILIMPVPNMFYEAAQSFTTIISTSFFEGEIPCAWKITKPFTKIIIPANQPVAAIIPISLKELDNSEIIFKNINNMPTSKINGLEHHEAIKKINDSGKWTNFYKDAVDYTGRKIGSHEVKNIKLFVKEEYE